MAYARPPYTYQILVCQVYGKYLLRDCREAFDSLVKLNPGFEVIIKNAQTGKIIKTSKKHK